MTLRCIKLKTKGKQPKYSIIVTEATWRQGRRICIFNIEPSNILEHGIFLLFSSFLVSSLGYALFFCDFQLAFCLLGALAHYNESWSFSSSFGSPDQGKWWRDHWWELRLVVPRSSATLLLLHLKTGFINSIFPLPSSLCIIRQAVYMILCCLLILSRSCVFLLMTQNTYSEIAPAQEESDCKKLFPIPGTWVHSPPMDNRVHISDYLIRGEIALWMCCNWIMSLQTDYSISI